MSAICKTRNNCVPICDVNAVPRIFKLSKTDKKQSNKMEKHKIIVGRQGSGKTNFAVGLSRKFGATILSTFHSENDMNLSKIVANGTEFILIDNVPHYYDFESFFLKYKDGVPMKDGSINDLEIVVCTQYLSEFKLENVEIIEIS